MMQIWSCTSWECRGPVDRSACRRTQGLATADHTTLLLNCYTKLKDVAKLDEFLHRSSADGGAPALNFDVDTAVKVPRSVGTTWPSASDSVAAAGMLCMLGTGWRVP